MNHLVEQVLGDWDLVEWRTTTLAGALVDHPFGDQPIGILSLTPNVLHVQMMRSARPSFTTPVVTAADRTGRHPGETVRAFETFMAYSGTWALDGDELTTTVVVGLIPEWRGSQQRRTVEVAGDRLQLRSRPRVVAGTEQIGVLDWRRRPTSGAGR